jgi:hypothetical protein
MLKLKLKNTTDIKNIKDKLFKNNNEIIYSDELLIQQYNTFKNYYIQRQLIKNKISIRLDPIPSDISENLIKYIIINILNDNTCYWSKTGDLHSNKYNKIECKCFTSDGPISFSPTPKWNVLFCLDMRKWIENKIILYKINVESNSDLWNSIIINKKETFNDQIIQKRRPRICWNNLYKQIKDFTDISYNGTFEDIFKK